MTLFKIILLFSQVNTKKLHFGLLLFFKLIGVFGQQNKIDIGAHGGPSLIFLRGNEIIEKFNEPTVGYCAGLFFQYNFPKFISINTAVNVEQKGSIAKMAFSDAFGNNNTLIIQSQFDYITVPVQIKTAFGDKVKLFINTGPYFGYLFKQTTISQTTNVSKFVTDGSTFFKPFDFGITLGCGASFPLKANFFISFENRNNLGLYDISANPVINNGKIKTYSGNLLVGFGYKIGRPQAKLK